MKTASKMRNDIVVIGLALFSMFFGAGNLIFPPYLAMTSGSEWFLGFLCFFAADVGLAMVAIFAMLRKNSDVEGVMEPLGRIPSKVMISAVILCVGPLLAVPRTGATVYELAVRPVLGEVSLALTSIVYFAIIMFLTLRESKVVDTLGKYLTPALLIGLIVLIIKGVMDPIGAVRPVPMIPNVPESGVLAGYQAMDVLGALAFGVIIVKIVVGKGYTAHRDKFMTAGFASLIAAVCLFVIYLGLSYLGSTASSMFAKDINQGRLTVEITELLLGRPGVIILGIVIVLACVTTAVALTSACGAYFSRLAKGRISYNLIVVIVCVFSAIVSNIGLSDIIAFAAPILSIVYPAAVVMIVLSLLGPRIRNDSIHRFAVLGALIVSVIEAGNVYLPYVWHMEFISKLPLSQFGFGWVVPAVVLGFVGAVVKRPRVNNKNEPPSI